MSPSLLCGSSSFHLVILPVRIFVRDQRDTVRRDLDLFGKKFFLIERVDLGLGQFAGADGQSHAVFDQQVDRFDLAGIFGNDPGGGVEPFENVDLLLDERTKTFVSTDFDDTARYGIGRLFAAVAAR